MLNFLLKEVWPIERGMVLLPLGEDKESSALQVGCTLHSRVYTSE